MSNDVMDNHSMIFVTVGNLVSPSSSVNGDPLFDFLTIGNLASPLNIPFAGRRMAPSID
jgi:hypothetical protein